VDISFTAHNPFLVLSKAKDWKANNWRHDIANVTDLRYFIWLFCFANYLSIFSCFDNIHRDIHGCIRMGNNKSLLSWHIKRKIIIQFSYCTLQHITCTRTCRFLVVGKIFRLETCMNSLVKVPPYSKFNLQEAIHACFKSKYLPNN
jgi:hypothetical protein